MARIIDAEPLRAKLTWLNEYDYLHVLNDIKSLPTIDAVPVVRCKDCRFHEREQPGIVWCPNIVGSWMAEDGFCSMGERREDG